MQEKIRVGIIGGAGYTGGELIRILLQHPNVTLVTIQSNSNTNKPLASVHHDLMGDTNLLFSADLSFDIDLVFLCAAHGEARQALQQHAINSSVKIIDLSNDFRLQKDSTFGERHFIYGLPELNRNRIQAAQHIANPGCFATAIQLGLLPLAKAGLLNQVYTTGITGSTGAGQALQQSVHFSWRANNIQPYKSLEHQHLFEIVESLQSLQPNLNQNPINFIPWRGDFTRGIFVSSQFQMDDEGMDLVKLYHDFYASHPFTLVADSPIYLKQVINTNKCFIYIEQKNNQVVVHSAIDNLIKGAAGQAVQNMNLMFGLHETEGLHLKASYF